MLPGMRSWRDSGINSNILLWVTNTARIVSIFWAHGPFFNLPAKFKSVPVKLSNGMLILHSYICPHHTSIWYYRPGSSQVRLFLHKPDAFSEPTACGSGGHGLPGDRGSLLFQHFCRYQKNIPEIGTSGHESRRAEGSRQHQCLRSVEARHRRWNNYTTARALWTGIITP